MVIPKNNNFEKIEFNQINEIEKLASYQKWKKEKYRIGNLKLYFN
jgi:hypothetical protein